MMEAKWFALKIGNVYLKRKNVPVSPADSMEVCRRINIGPMSAFLFKVNEDGTIDVTIYVD